MPIRRVLCCFFLLLGFLHTQATASERITGFHSDIQVQPDRSLLVTETIDVIAEHANIRRGIYRDLPTIYPHSHWGDMGFKEKTRFEIISITLDGKKSPWHQDNLSNGIRLYIGDPEHYVSRGAHRYVIRYLSWHQIARSGKTDILNWNVNGQGWRFPIDEISAHVSLSGGYPLENYTAWTGPQGSQESDYKSIVNDDGSIHFRSSRHFGPGEGMTILLWLPPGVVAPPDGSMWRLLRDNFKWLAGIFLILLLPYYYLRAWYSVGRDPQKGVVVADYHPVRNLSPAAHRFVTLNRTDDTAFSAALVNIAIKGYLRIEKRGGKAFYLYKRIPEETSADKLTDNEQVVYNTLFSGADRVELGGKYHKEVAKAKKKLAKLLKLEWQEAVYRNNRRYSWFGLIVGVGALILCNQHLSNSGLNPTSLMPFAVFIFFGIGLTQRKLHALALLPPFMFFANRFTESGFSAPGSNLMIGLSLFVSGLFVLFYFLLKAPTPFGQKLLDEIEGFRLYLGTAEQHRLNILHPPDKTPELFEQLLPYAIALGVENQWGEQFAGILNRSTNEEAPYQPGWYVGDTHRGFRVSGFSSGLGAGLSGSIASAATAPSSSSGGFSGGGAGGGGGGGGGGGW